MTRVPRARAALLRYGVAIAVVIAAFVVRLTLLAALEQRVIYITFFPAVAVAAVFGGAGPGVAALLASVAASQALVAPSSGLSGSDPYGLLGIATFLGSGALIIWACSALRTARERAEHAQLARREADLRSEESEARFRRMADAAPVLIWISDTSEVRIWFNRPWLEFVGRTMDEELGDGWTEHVHPEDLDRCLATCSAAFEDRDPFHVQYRLRRHDGRYRWLFDHGIPTFDVDDAFRGYVGSCIDVTELKEAEQAIRASEERLRDGLRAGDVGTFEVDLATRRVTWSDKVFEFYGIERSEFDSSLDSVFTLIHPGDHHQIRETMRGALDDDRDYRVEYRIVRPDGELRWLSANGRAVRGPDGKATGMIGAVTDVTVRKQAEIERDALLASERRARSEAERMSRMKDEFLATLSHELRTPLHAVVGWVTILGQYDPERDHLKEGLAAIERNARALTALVDDLLDMSRIVGGNLRLDVQPVDLPSVIESALSALQPAADAKGIRVRRILDPLAGPVQGDPARLQQVMWNLLSNAVKFTPKGGRVHVALQRINSHVEISVSDDGIGIAPEFLPSLFQRFRQADASTTRRHSGLGLGLAIVKQLVELHGGTVVAESEGEGHGATFRVALPLPPSSVDRRVSPDRVHPSAGPLTSARPTHTVDLTGVRVLVVDDEADARLLLQMVLERAGAAVAAATSAEDALSRLDGTAFDVVVSDIGMPVVDGFTFAERLRGLPDERVRSVPAVALTAFARSEDRRRAMHAGFDMYLSKPVDPDELVAVVARLTRKS